MRLIGRVLDDTELGYGASSLACARSFANSSNLDHQPTTNDPAPENPAKLLYPRSLVPPSTNESFNCHLCGWWTTNSFCHWWILVTAFGNNGKFITTADKKTLQLLLQLHLQPPPTWACAGITTVLPSCMTLNYLDRTAK